MQAARDGLLTLLLGFFLGYLVVSVAGPLLTENAVTGNTSESRQARAFMLGLLREDPDALIALRPNRDVASRALELRSTEQGKGQTKAVSLTYLGGGDQGRFQVHIYAVELTVGQQVRFFPLALTLLNGKVVRTE